jgi:trigger factor
LEIVLDRKSTTLASLNIKIAEADYLPEVNKKLKEYSKKAVMKGFRPGKVPVQLVKKMYGKTLLAEEVQKILSSQMFGYIRENKLTLVGEPLPDNEHPAIDFDNEKDFEFVYRLGLAGDFTVNINELDIIKYNVVQTEEQMTEIVNNLRKEYGSHEHPEVVEAGDLLSGQLLQILPPAAEDEAQPEAIDQKVYIELNQVNEAIQATLIGLSKENATPIVLDLNNLFEEDNQTKVAQMLNMEQEDLANLSGEFQFTLEEIHRTVPAEMDKAFFTKIFNDESIETEDEFINQLKTNITNNYLDSSEAYILKQIIKKLPQLTTIELPHEFLKEWVGIVNEGKFTPEKIEEEYDLFTNNLKWDLIKNQIAAQQNLNVSDEEVYLQAQAIVSSQLGGFLPHSGQDPRLVKMFDDFVNHYLEGNDGRNYQTVVKKALEIKVFEYIKASIVLSEKEINSKDFEALYYSRD